MKAVDTVARKYSPFQTVSYISISSQLKIEKTYSSNEKWHSEPEMR
jgi:hypothetical protein